MRYLGPVMRFAVTCSMDQVYYFTVIWSTGVQQKTEFVEKKTVFCEIRKNFFVDLLTYRANVNIHNNEF